MPPTHAQLTHWAMKLNAAFSTDQFVPSGDGAGLTLGTAPAGGAPNIIVGADPMSPTFSFPVGQYTREHPLDVTLFDGFLVHLMTFSIRYQETPDTFSESQITAILDMPLFFSHGGQVEQADMVVLLNDDSKTCKLALAPMQHDPDRVAPDGSFNLALTFDSPSSGSLISQVSIELHIAQMATQKPASGGSIQLNMGGKLTMSTPQRDPHANNIDWPEFQFNGLRIDSQSNIELDGGWLDLKDKAALNYTGFHAILHKIGFGVIQVGADKQRWIGFTGEMKVGSGVEISGQIIGLRIGLDAGDVTLTGIAVGLVVPNVFTFKGKLEVIHARTQDDMNALDTDITLPSTAAATWFPIDLVTGEIELKIDALRGLDVDAKFLSGTFGADPDKVSVFFIDIGAVFSPGIVIFSNISLYGLEGLFAYNLHPDPTAHGHSWWEWYKYPIDSTTGDPAVSEITPTGDDAYSATAINKWIPPQEGALGFGAGVTFGTSADNGYTVHAGVLLGLMLPGPIIFLDGKADLLKRLSIPHGTKTKDAAFHAMAVYDGNAETFELAVDVHYTITTSTTTDGETNDTKVLDLQGGADLFVSPSTWYFALGKPPRDKRITAKIIDIFDASAYFVISDSGLITGAYFGLSKNYDFGVGSAGVSAYIAALLAIQWAPFQFGGGLELHGEAHLVFFGLHFGLTLDALIEGCAPHPLWLHGECSFELDLPWPLPDVGGTLSFDWGGDDGSIPPPPLSLSSIQAGMADHGASDAYTLLAHETGAPVADATVRYDGATEGILAPDATNQAAWDARIASAPHPADILPDLNPDAPVTGQTAALVPLDAHFTLGFSHPTHDKAGVGGAIFAAASAAESDIQPDIEPVSLPVGLPADDMSHLNPNPPKPQWEYQHSLLQVGLYAYQSGAWTKIASSDDTSTPVALRGDWRLPAAPGSTASPPPPDPASVNTRLHVIALSPGAAVTANWISSTSIATFPATFQDQGLTFSVTAGGAPSLGGYGVGSALIFPTTGGVFAWVTVRFPEPVRVQSMTYRQTTGRGEVPSPLPLTWEGDGVTMPVASTAFSDGNYMVTDTFANTAPPVRELRCAITPGYELCLGEIVWTQMVETLPEPTTLYALKVVTGIEARRVSDTSAPFQPATPGANPVVEFAYFQTAAGPGLSVMVPPPPDSPPNPYAAPPYPPLAQNAAAPATAFPAGGRLSDLASYAQWSWPGDQDLAAYYGYDLNVEFNESYVNYLYEAFSPGGVRDALRFRVVDTNHHHVLPRTVAITVPSAPGQSALVADGSYIPPQPATIAAPPSHIIDPVRSETLHEIEAIAHANLGSGGTGASAPSAPSGRALVSLGQVAAHVSGARQNFSDLLGNAGIAGGGVSAGNAGVIAHGGSIFTIPGGIGTAPDWSGILRVAQEMIAAQEARAIWPRALQANTRYRVDVVAGGSGGHDRGLLHDVDAAPDAIDALQALRDFYSANDALTSLHRLEFTTSRYQTFTAQIANAVAQAAGGGSTPLRTYTVTTDVQAWLAANDSGSAPGSRGAAQATYLAARGDLQTFMDTFNPLHDEADLKSRRDDVEVKWRAFATATYGAYDSLIAALGMPDLASNAAPPAPPDTELSILMNTGGDRIEALLLESPEPLAWRRLWQWTALRPADAHARAVSDVRVLWCGDGTRALIIPVSPYGSYHLEMTFQGDIGAEAPCLTTDSHAVRETATFTAMTFTPELIGVVDPNRPLPGGVIERVPHIPVDTPLPPSIPTGPIPGPGPIERPGGIMAQGPLVEPSGLTQAPTVESTMRAGAVRQSFFQRLWTGFLRFLGIGR